jgi:peptidoglycan/LPS O-acetylase OafA/YrhL
MIPLVTVSDRRSLLENLATFYVAVALCHELLLPIGMRVVAYSFCFYLGVLLPRIIRTPVGAAIGVNSWLVVAELIAEFFLRLWAVDEKILTETKYTIDALVSGHAIAFVMLSPVRWLRWRPLIWLGDISYSFYVFAQLFLTLFAFVLMKTFPEAWRWTLSGRFMIASTSLFGCLAVTLPLAALSYRLIELPGIRIGKRILELRHSLFLERRA